MNARLVRVTIAFALLTTMAATISAQDSAMQGLADYLSISLSQQPKQTVAVVDFTDLQGNVTDLGRFFAAQLESDVIGSGKKIDLVDRTRLKLIMQEHKLSTTGIIDPATARQLGKFAGVQILITGTITPLTDTIHLTIKAINTEDARIVAAKSRDILKTRDIIAIVGQSAVSPQNPPSESTPGDPTENPAPPPIPKAPGPWIVEEQNVRFSLKSCILSGSSVTCHLTLTNLGEDRQLTIYIHTWTSQTTRFIDGNGRENRAIHATLGSFETTDSMHEVESTLVTGVQTQAELKFDKIPSDISSIALLDMPGRVGDKEFKVQFRKIPVLVKRY